MKEIFRIIGLQLGIFFLHQSMMHYFVIEKQIYYLAPFETAIILAHCLTLVIIFIVKFSKNQDKSGIGYAISFIMILTIGFGTCSSIAPFFGRPPIQFNQSRIEKQMDSIQNEFIADSIRNAMKIDSLKQGDVFPGK